MPEWSRRSVISTLAGGVAAAQITNDSRPNTLVVLVDDWRWDSFGVAGHPWIKTPHIDRIAREGVRFLNAFCTTPLCSPARASFLTGQYAHQHDVRTNAEHGPLSMKLMTFPRLQQKAGYETAYFGQWRMGAEDAPRPGFDRWISFKGQGTYVNPVLNVDGRQSAQTGYVTDLLSNAAVEFIRRRKEGRPFGLVLAHKGIHAPFTPADRHKSLYAAEPVRRAPSSGDSLEGKPVLRRKIDPQLPQQRPPSDETIRAQAQCLASVDEGLGKALAALEETRQLDNTVVIVTSDNGFFWGEHQLGDKRAAYEPSIRIPILIRFPRLIRPNTRLRDFVLNVDLAPTLCELSRTSPVPGMRGRSLVPLLEGRARGWRQSFLTEYYAEPGHPRVPSWQAVRTSRWKYIRYTELDGQDEFYDLASDPGEMRNLMGDPSAQAALGDCKEELARLWRETF
jgi:arylsulfatase A-like enzyme